MKLCMPRIDCDVAELDMEAVGSLAVIMLDRTQSKSKPATKKDQSGDRLFRELRACRQPNRHRMGPSCDA